MAVRVALGGCFGLALAVATIRLSVGLMPAQVPRLTAVGLDGRLLSFALLISVGSGILFGLVPALHASKIKLTDSIAETWSRTGGERKGQSRFRGALVGSEVALAVVLLLGASLLLQSFVHLMRVDPGFDPHNVLTFELDAPAAQPGAAEAGHSTSKWLCGFCSASGLSRRLRHRVLCQRSTHTRDRNSDGIGITEE